MSHVATFCHVRHVTSYFDAANVRKIWTPVSKKAQKKLRIRPFLTFFVHSPRKYQENGALIGKKVVNLHAKSQTPDTHTNIHN